MAKKLKWNLILMSLLYLALGIFLLMVPGTALNVVCYAPVSYTHLTLPTKLEV